MERYDKKNMTIYSKEYDDLLAKEINVWSQYTSSKDNSYEQIKETAPFQTYRKNTVELELEYIKKCGNNIGVLELGSADGWLTNEIIRLNNVENVTSIDISLNQNLREKYNPKSRIVSGDLNKIEKIKFNNKFDCIITHGTLHHLVDPKKTLLYCLDNLLTKQGIIIINDTWISQTRQFKINAFLYSFLNSLPHAILRLDIIEASNLLFYKIPRIILDRKFAESIAHTHKTSPFESISSADDYKEIYDRKDIDILYFRNFAALPGLQNSWGKSPRIIKNMIQELDDFLIRKKIFTGDVHISIIKKK